MTTPKLVDSGSNYIPVIMSCMATGGHVSVLSNNVDGTVFVAFATQPCAQVTICNDTGTVLEIRQGGSGVAIPIFDSSYYTFFAVGDMSTLSVRRKDVSTTQVTVKARWEA